VREKKGRNFLSNFLILNKIEFAILIEGLIKNNYKGKKRLCIFF
jgi:hypothetical protein